MNGDSANVSEHKPAATTVRPVFRWAGSKRRLLGDLLAAQPESFSRYWEPFVGSACYFLAIGPEAASISDRNAELMNAYSVLRTDARELAVRLHSTSADRSTYNRLRSVDPEALESFERAFRFAYLNRYSFNGVWRTNLRGEFNVPFGSKQGRVPTVEAFEAIGRALENVSIGAGDFADFIGQATTGDFVYLDPPYTARKTPEKGLYGGESFTDRDLDRLIGLALDLDRRNVSVLISYSDSERLRGGLPDWEHRKVSDVRTVSAATHGRGRTADLLSANYVMRGG